MTHRTRIVPFPRSFAPWCVACAIAGVAGFAAHAEPPPPRAAATAGEGRSWASLTPAQQNALRPLQQEWNAIEASRKIKWIEIADRLPAMQPEERERVQARMAGWAMLSPRERGQARLNYKEALQVPAEDRKARWEAYQSLPVEQQRQLAERASPGSAPARRTRRDDPPTKSTVVPNQATVRPNAISPSVAQAQPGATTNLVTKRPSPPTYQQPGLPKIATGASFVDNKTLLPKRGAQGAATGSAAAASAPIVIARP